jgi:hypothetical protein
MFKYSGSVTQKGYDNITFWIYQTTYNDDDKDCFIKYSG